MIPAFNLGPLLPANKSKFYRYNGSLTTPTCNEAVTWTVFNHTVEISQGQVRLFTIRQFLLLPLFFFLVVIAVVVVVVTVVVVVVLEHLHPRVGVLRISSDGEVLGISLGLKLFEVCFRRFVRMTNRSGKVYFDNMINK